MNRKLSDDSRFTNAMRLDLFLKASRVCPRRTMAQRLCDAGLVLVNGTSAKSAHPVKVDDEISIRKRNKTTTLRVLSLPETRQTCRKESSELYEVLSEEQISEGS